MNGNEGFPNNEQVRLIYKDTYNYFLKWIAVKEVDWNALLSDAKEIEHKYPFELCKKILVELIAVIEANFMEKEENHG